MVQGQGLSLAELAVICAGSCGHDWKSCPSRPCSSFTSTISNFVNDPASLRLTALVKMVSG